MRWGGGEASGGSRLVAAQYAAGVGSLNMWVESSKPATLTLVALGAGLLLYLPAQPPSVGEPRPKARQGLLNCSSLEEVTELEWIASGWTKAVYRGRLRGRDIAVKTVNLDGHDIESCLERPEAPSLARCYRRTSAKLLREFILLQELQHPNVIKAGQTRATTCGAQIINFDRNLATASTRLSTLSKQRVELHQIK